MFPQVILMWNKYKYSKQQSNIPTVSIYSIRKLPCDIRDLELLSLGKSFYCIGDSPHPPIQKSNPT